MDNNSEVEVMIKELNNLLNSISEFQNKYNDVFKDIEFDKDIILTEVERSIAASNLLKKYSNL